MDIIPGPNFLKFKDFKITIDGVELRDPLRCGPFHQFDLKPATLKTLRKKNYQLSTPVQTHVIPAIEVGRDVLACSPTGTGKTAAFLIPIIDKLLKTRLEPVTDLALKLKNLKIDSEWVCSPDASYPYVFIITATRELAIQTLQLCKNLIENTAIVALPIYGGTKSKDQIADLTGKGAHILVATPGRLKHFLRDGIISFSAVKFIVLDEADKMLLMGFGSDLKYILKHESMTVKPQTLMFSATYPNKQLEKIRKSYMVNSLAVIIDELNAPSLDVDENFIEINPQKDYLTKYEKLLELLYKEEDKNGPQLTLIFVNRKRDCYKLADILDSYDYSVEAMTSDEDQETREQILAEFRDKKFNILVATDVVGRGINIRDLAHVINFNMPRDMAEYVNRIGRTGRLGNPGKATSFFQPGLIEDDKTAHYIVSCLGHLQKDVPEFLLKSAAKPEKAYRGGRNRRWPRRRPNGTANAKNVTQGAAKK